MNLIKLFKTPYYLYRFTRDIVFCNIKLGAWDKTWRFHDLPLIQKSKGSEIKIGKNFVACSNPKNNTIGVFQKVTIKTLSRNSEIIIKENVGMSGVTISCAQKIIIGNNVLLGSGVLITDNDAHPIHPDLRNKNEYTVMKSVVIEDDVFIGARAIILKGVTIGKGSVIGAGAVVSKDIPSMSIAAGNPAIVIGNLNDEKYKTTNLL